MPIDISAKVYIVGGLLLNLLIYDFAFSFPQILLKESVNQSIGGSFLSSYFEMLINEQ